MVEAVLVILFEQVARGRPQLVAASGRPELCLHAWDQQGNVVVSLTLDVPLILDEI